MSGRESLPVVRRARPEDYEDVMDINRTVYHITDYLPCKYYDYLRDPDRVCIVCEYKGKVVGFKVNYVLDGGRTVIGQGARVRAAYQGRGYMSALHAYTDKEGDKLCSNVREVRWKIADWHSLDKRKWKLLGYRICVPIAVPWDMKTPREITAPAERANRKHRTELLSNDQALDFLLDKDIQWRLFPHGHLVAPLEPYRLMLSNFKIIVRGSHRIFAGFDRATGIAKSISFGNIFPNAVGLTYKLDYYSENDDIDDAYHHFLQHHASLAKYRCASGRLVFVVYFGPRADVDSFIDNVGDIDGAYFFQNNIRKEKMYLATTPYTAASSKL